VDYPVLLLKTVRLTDLFFFPGLFLRCYCIYTRSNVLLGPLLAPNSFSSLSNSHILTSTSRGECLVFIILQTHFKPSSLYLRLQRVLCTSLLSSPCLSNIFFITRKAFQIYEVYNTSGKLQLVDGSSVRRKDDNRSTNIKIIFTCTAGC